MKKITNVLLMILLCFLCIACSGGDTQKSTVSDRITSEGEKAGVTEKESNNVDEDKSGNNGQSVKEESALSEEGKTDEFNSNSNEGDDQNQIDNEKKEIIREDAIPLEILVTEEYETEWKAETGDSTEGEFVQLYEVSWELLGLSDEGADAYPQLQKALQQINHDTDTEKREIIDWIIPSAEEIYHDRDEYYTALSSKNEYLVQRADDRIVSIREDFSEYTGGVHGIYGSFGINYDPQTGEKLLITDVLKDAKILPKLISPIIREKYADEYDTYDNLEEILGEYEPADYTWTLGYQGITFYFNPYEIAPFSEGLLTATLWFDEHYEIFKEKYLSVPANGYMTKVSSDTVIELDIDKEEPGKDTLMIYQSANFWQDDDLLNLELIKNGEKYQEDKANYAYEFETYLVCLREQGRERYYLYALGNAENDYSTIYTYDLNGDKITPIEKLSGLSFAGRYTTEKDYYKKHTYIFTDTEQIAISTRMDILGTWWAEKSYTVTSGEGKLKSGDEEYKIHHLYEPLVSKIPLLVTIFLEEEQESREELPAGSEFTLLGTDGKSYVDFILKDGREGRINLEYEDQTYMINGMQEWECFEILPYAG